MIEALRALEKKWREMANDRANAEWVTLVNCANELRDLIAELGQEVAPVAPAWFYIRTPGADYDYSFTKTREEAIDLQDCDEPDEPIPLYTSPAHTSEARDAARLDWLVSAGTLNIAHWYRSGMAPFVELVDQDETQIAEGRTLREAIDAAMRQEAE